MGTGAEESTISRCGAAPGSPWLHPIVIKGSDDKVGSSMHDGLSLSARTFRARGRRRPGFPDVYHNKFQDPRSSQAGARGRQYQVLVEARTSSTGSLRPELIDKSIIGWDRRGVVIPSAPGGLHRRELQHGELVEKGYRGVWREPLMPGKYAFNTAGQIIRSPRPTSSSSDRHQAGEHRYDENPTKSA